MKTRNKGITLIALVVTTVILLILAGVSINLLLGENGLITKAREAREQTYIAAAQEAVSLGWGSCTTDYIINAGDTEKQTYFEQNIKKNIDEQNKEGNYVESGSSINVEGTSIVNYSYKNKVYKFNVDKDGKVTYAGKKNQTSKKDNIARVEPPASEYKLVGDVYCNSPDLSGFARDATYYVTYDDNGNETINGRIDTVNPPSNWYDYSENAKKWANIVTITDNQISYWVWIPKYVYSLDTSGKTVNTCFVTQDTVASEAQYNYKTKDGDKTVSASEYKMPDSFTFDTKNLAGMWVSKYEISESYDINKEEITYDRRNGKITVSTTEPSGEYIIFVDGVEKNAKTLPYIINNTIDDEEYDVCVISKERGPIGRAVVKAEEIDVDLSGFNPECTYYVTYDSNGNETYKRIDKGQPDNWYNYTSKEWANIVTINEDQIAYWTYIPRYEYSAYSASQRSNVKFIKKTQTKADPGYIIPECFKFDGKDLAGIWSSKYEISE